VAKKNIVNVLKSRAHSGHRSRDCRLGRYASGDRGRSELGKERNEILKPLAKPTLFYNSGNSQRLSLPYSIDHKISKPQTPQSFNFSANHFSATLTPSSILSALVPCPVRVGSFPPERPPTTSETAAAQCSAVTPLEECS
jgi:hypothetical protein